MYEFHPYYTTDGSIGLYNTDFKDIYHSANGALSEAFEKFVYPLFGKNILNKPSVKVLDICYGIGYNSKSFLNFLLSEKFSQQKFQKKSQNFLEKFFEKFLFGKQYICPIHTNNIFTNFDQNNIEYIDKIHTNNNSQKIFIKAIDNDKILTYLSPMIKNTYCKNYKNKDFDFDTTKIEKYLTQINNTYTNYPPLICDKINKLINYYLFESISHNVPDFYTNECVKNIINSKEYARYFDPFIKGLYNFNYALAINKSSLYKLTTFLHNIYYRNMSYRYKKDLKTYNFEEISFQPENDDARKVIKNDKIVYDVIFLDAFTPQKCPCLWSYEFLNELYKHIDQNGLLLTYTNSATVRSALIECGFFIGKIKSKLTGKFVGTIASKNKNLIDYPLSQFESGLLKTTAGIFYRDEHLSSTNEQILDRRNKEISTSSKMSSSKYVKNYKNS